MVLLCWIFAICSLLCWSLSMLVYFIFKVARSAACIDCIWSHWFWSVTRSNCNLSIVFSGSFRKSSSSLASSWQPWHRQLGHHQHPWLSPHEQKLQLPQSLGHCWQRGPHQHQQEGPHKHQNLGHCQQRCWHQQLQEDLHRQSHQVIIDSRGRFYWRGQMTFITVINI